MKGYLHMRVPSRDAHGPEFNQSDYDMSGIYDTHESFAAPKWVSDNEPRDGKEVWELGTICCMVT